MRTFIQFGSGIPTPCCIHFLIYGTNILCYTCFMRIMHILLFILFNELRYYFTNYHIPDAIIRLDNIESRRIVDIRKDSLPPPYSTIPEEYCTIRETNVPKAVLDDGRTIAVIENTQPSTSTGGVVLKAPLA